MRESDMMLGIHEIEGIGWETMQLIVRSVPDLRLFLERPATELLKNSKVPPKKADLIERVLTYEYIAGKLRFYEQCGVRPVTCLDEEYPPLLMHVHRPPWVIYTQGDLELLQKPSIAVVGTRNPSPYGREVAEWFGADLAAYGLPVVSGLARGVDSYAHAGALRTTGATIAVLGNGLNVCYPPEHHGLQRQIARRGLVISEYSWNAKPSKGTFPWRNRIIAGITLGTVIVEAAAKSGSLLTAQYALDNGKEIFAVPGPILSPRSAGVNGLIRDGAALVTSPKEIAAAFGIEVAPDAPSRMDRGEPLTEEEAHLLSLMGAEAVSIDELQRRSKVNFGHLHTVLLSLLVKNRIRALPGSLYMARMN